MKKKFGLNLFSLVFFIFSTGSAVGQVDTLKVPLPSAPIQYNAGFDVIIKTDGDIVYGIVKEVGLSVITYKRTDIPDGPIYTILRSEVYAISYRNQVKEYFTPAYVQPAITEPVIYPKIDFRHKIIFEEGVFHLGFGFIKNLTKVDNSKDYSSSNSFPAVLVSYDVRFKDQVRLGMQLGFSSHNFSRQDYSSYDSIQNNINLKENIFSLMVYAKYSFQQNSSRLKPYIIGGIGIISSRIKSENTISFTNDNSQSILVKSGTHSSGLGGLARIGAEYYLNDQFHLFLDAGLGTAVIQAGVGINLK